MDTREHTKKLANDIRTKIYGKEVREALAIGIEESGDTSQEARDITENLLDGSYDTGLLNTEIEQRMEGLYSSKGQAMDDLYTQKNTELTDLYINEKSELDTLQADYADRAETLETTYAPRLTSAEQDITTNHQEVTAQLAQTMTIVNKSDDDTHNIQEAINKGGLVKLVGVDTVFEVSQIVLKDDVTFFSDKNVVIKQIEEVNQPLIIGEGKKNFNVKGIEFDGNNNTGSTMRIENCENFEIIGNKVKNGYYGISVYDSVNFKISENEVFDCVYYGISVSYDNIRSENFIISNNIVHNIKNSNTSGDLVDGTGIFIKGSDISAEEKIIKNVVVSGNITHSNGRSGITILGCNFVNVVDNISYNNKLNTLIGSGIIISAASKYINVSNNICYENYDAGILVDVATDTHDESGDFGFINVTSNIVYKNYRTGIKNNNAPKLNISNNQVHESLWGIFSNRFSNQSTISGNIIDDCSENGIRLIGNTIFRDDAQKDIIVSENRISNCSHAKIGTSAGLYVENFENVLITGNIFRGGQNDLILGSNNKGVELSNNIYSARIVVDRSETVRKWADTFRETATSFSSQDFSGDLIQSIRLQENFKLHHFGLDLLFVWSSEPFSSDDIMAIPNGYSGQLLTIVNIASSSFAIKNGANVNNLDGQDVSVEGHSHVKYVFKKNNGWLQIS